MLRQSDAQVFKKYSQTKLQMKREALEKLNRRANEMAPVVADVQRLQCAQSRSNDLCTVRAQSGLKVVIPVRSNVGKCFRMNKAVQVGA